MAFDVDQFISSGGKGVSKDAASIRTAAEAIVAKGKDYYSQKYGNSRIFDLAQNSVLGAYLPAAEADPDSFDYSSKALDRAYNTLTLANDVISFDKLNKGYEEKKADVSTKIAENTEWLANRLDFSGWDLNDPAQKAKADEMQSDTIVKQKQSELDSYLKLAETFGVDTAAAQKITNTGSYLTADVLNPTPVAKTTTPAVEDTSAVTSAFKPTEYSVTNGLADLQANVMSANSSASANKEFVNAVFKAFHNRDATAAELAAYTGKAVSDVRTEIIGGAQAAGLPTVKAGTVNVPTGVLTPEQAKAQGLQKVLRPDQLSAFSEDQIVRDSNGGIWLKAETTTQAQRDAVASGKSGTSIGKADVPSVGSSVPASAIEEAIELPDASSLLELMGSGDSGSTASEQATGVVEYASSYLDSIVSKYDAMIASYQTKLASTNSTLDTLTDKVADLTTATPNADALEAAIEAQGLKEKQADLVKIQTEIANIQAELDLGLIRQSNKLAPLSIIGSRQATLQSQGLAKIGALTSIAQVLQGDIDIAKSMVDATVSAMNADRTAQLSALDTLIGLTERKITQLSDEERSILEARQEALNDAIDSAQKDADKVFDLIKDNPGAALKGKVSLSDSAAVALAKMAPYMTSSSDRKTQVVDLGGRKVLVDLQTGEEIKSFTETGSGGGSGGSSQDIAEYVENIKAGILGLSDVPQSQRDDVATALRVEGFDLEYADVKRGLQDYHDADYSRNEVEELYGGDIPIDVEKALNELWGEDSSSSWWSNTWNGIKNWFVSPSDETGGGGSF